jgi:hypothetical protein
MKTWRAEFRGRKRGRKWIAEPDNWVCTVEAVDRVHSECRLSDEMGFEDIEELHLAEAAP